MNKGNPHHDEKGKFSSAQSSTAKIMRYVPPRNVSAEPMVHVGPGFTGKAIAKDISKKGIVYSLVKHANGKYGVYVLAENYAGHVRGGIAKTWRYVKKEMDWSEAKSLYDKRLG